MFKIMVINTILYPEEENSVFLSDTSVNIYQITRRNIPGDNNPDDAMDSCELRTALNTDLKTFIESEMEWATVRFSLL
jgi:hypothetical protein